jgi:hypothetical protein
MCYCFMCTNVIEALYTARTRRCTRSLPLRWPQRRRVCCRRHRRTPALQSAAPWHTQVHRAPGACVFTANCPERASGKSSATAQGQLRPGCLFLCAEADGAAPVPDNQLPNAAGQALSEADAERLGGLRARLQALLQGSPLVDGPALLARLRGTALWEEQVLLHSKVGGRTPMRRTAARAHAAPWSSQRSVTVPPRPGCPAVEGSPLHS